MNIFKIVLDRKMKFFLFVRLLDKVVLKFGLFVFGKIIKLCFIKINNRGF